MRRPLALAAVCLGLLGLPAAAAAHPLGNFTVSTYDRVELSGGALYVRHVRDMAEIPTFRVRAGVERAGGPAAWARREAPAVARDIVVTAAGRRLPLVPVSQTARLVPGQGGLPTLRLDAWFRAPAAGSVRGTVPLTVTDRSAAGRTGYRAVVVRTSGGARAEGRVPTADPTRELRAYPRDLAVPPGPPPVVRVRWTPGEGPGPVAAATADPSARGVSAGRGGLGGVVEGDLTPGAVLLGLLLAMAWGAAHALSPGHGKAMVAAYLVGARGTTRHALLLGLFVTVTHTAGVIALGLVTLWLSSRVLPETLYPWLNLVAGLMVVGVGAAVLRTRLRAARRARRRVPAVAAPRGRSRLRPRAGALAPVGAPAPGAGRIRVRTAPGAGIAGHAHGHHHGPGGHTHAPPADLSMRGLLAVGASAGVVPCPSALVLLLGAIAVQRVGWGLVLVLAFSAGLAGLLSLIGLLVVHARRLVARVPGGGRLPALVPVGSAVVILVIGAVLVARAVPPLV